MMLLGLEDVTSANPPECGVRSAKCEVKQPQDLELATVNPVGFFPVFSTFCVLIFAFRISPQTRASVMEAENQARNP
jgi:hypothetical protein